LIERLAKLLGLAIFVIGSNVEPRPGTTITGSVNLGAINGQAKTTSATSSNGASNLEPLSLNT
jgi:hypothetical protein